MVILPDVTLFSIDVVKPHLTVEAMDFSSRFVEFADIVLMTDLERNEGMWHAKVTARTGLKPIQVLHHVESDRKIQCPRASHYPLPIDYEIASMREPIGKFKTSHILFMEWDSAVLNPLAWDPSWLDYDYIGAPWSPFHEQGWDPCDGHTNNVGNAGFSLRSQRYCEATKRMLDVFPEDLKLLSCDMTPCLNRRKWLESQGVKFAPDYVAKHFSCENSIYAGQFGYHGPWTAEMNGWGGPFFDKRKKTK